MDGKRVVFGVALGAALGGVVAGVPGMLCGGAIGVMWGLFDM